MNYVFVTEYKIDRHAFELKNTYSLGILGTWHKNLSYLNFGDMFYG